MGEPGGEMMRDGGDGRGDERGGGRWVGREMGGKGDGWEGWD